MGSSFFRPFIGEKYDEGINGKKILVFGASFYCDKNGESGRKLCPFFNECTNPNKKDSSKFNTTCPEYAGKEYYGEKKELSNEPKYAIDSQFSAYKNFAEFLSQFVENKNYDVWDRVAFTNYMQFLSPTTKTFSQYLSERDFEAFCETITELKPDIVVTWGVTTLNRIREENQYVTDLDKLLETEHYIWHMKLPEMEHGITLINCYHPKSRTEWRDNFEIFTKYFRIALNQ